MPSDNGSVWSPPASSSERRLSNSSDGSAGSGHFKAITDSVDFLATRPRTAAVIPGKPAANPLQFVKVGPADLGSRAREQLRKAELAKRTEPSTIERQEDWQSNLDNWKSSRRKRVEHIIERCVEVRRMENETGQPRTKSKTFNEMLEERTARRRRNPLALYTDDDGHDFSDLGIGTSSTKSSFSEDCDAHSLASDGIDLDKNHSDVDNLSNCDNNRQLSSSANEYDTCTTTTISSPEPEEYTYEGAIEGYKSRIISQSNSNIVKIVVNNNFKEKSPDKINADLNSIRTTISKKIEVKVPSFRNDRNNDTKNNNQKRDIPKVHKRREQFERENSQEFETRLPSKVKEFLNERFGASKKFPKRTQVHKSTSDLIKLPKEVKLFKERSSLLEKIKLESTDAEKFKRFSNGDLNSTKSLKERLSCLESQTSAEENIILKTEVKEVSMNLKGRLFSLDAKHKQIPNFFADEEIVKNAAIKTDEPKDNRSSLKLSFASMNENQMRSFCRSFAEDGMNEQASPNSFEIVSSLKGFDCAKMENNTTSSDIETENSGIHTARDSCVPLDDITDLTQVASPIGKTMIKISEYGSSNEDSTGIIKPDKIEEPIGNAQENAQKVIQDIIIEEAEEQETKTEDTDSDSHYLHAVSQPEELTVTEDISEIQMDKEDEDTLQSLDNHDSSVSLNEPVSTTTEGDTVVFKGKMTIHVNFNEICNYLNAGAGKNNWNNPNTTKSTTNCKSMPMVTVSNITTTTNFSPTNSIKTLKETSESHSVLINEGDDVTCTFKRSLDDDVDACNLRHHVNNVINNSQNNNVIKQTSDVAANKCETTVNSLQDSDPFWQEKVRRYLLEANRRKTILFINNKVTTKTVSNSNKSDAKSNI